MFIHETFTRVCYADTDAMGIVYHGSYTRFLENARSEAFRTVGMTYKDMEQNGLRMPVAQLAIKFRKPAYYDDQLRIQAIIPELPVDHKIHFFYKVFNPPGDLLCRAQTILYCLQANNMKPTPLPAQLLENLQTFFKKS